MSMVLILSSQTLGSTPELDTSFDEADAMPCSVSVGCLCLLVPILITLNYS